MSRLGDSMRDVTATPPPTRIDVDRLIRREARRTVLLRVAGGVTAAVCTVAAITVVPTLLTGDGGGHAGGDRAANDHSDRLTTALRTAVRDVGGPQLALNNLTSPARLGTPSVDFPYGFGRRDGFYGYMSQLTDPKGYVAIVAEVDVGPRHESAECEYPPEIRRNGWSIRLDEGGSAHGEMYRFVVAVREDGACVRLRLQNSLAMMGDHQVHRTGLPLDEEQLISIAYRLEAALRV